VGIIVRKLGLESGASQNVVISFSGILEEIVRFAILFSIGRSFTVAYFVGVGWSAIEVVYAIVTAYVIETIMRRDDPEALKIQNMLREMGMIHDLGVFIGLSERIFASMFHIGMALSIAKWPWFLPIAIVLHSLTNLTISKLQKSNLNATDPDRPGIVTFKSAGMLSPLWPSPIGLPDNCWQPSVPDFYRYSLSQNCVDVALMGPEKRSHIDAALAGLEKGKLSEKEIDYLNLYGDLHRQRLSKQNLPNESFCALALEFSQGKQSKENGGFAGIKFVAELLPEIAAAIEQADAGCVLDPIQSRLGYHILRRVSASQTLLTTRK
jgi:PPIC-type PPIASE domain